MGKSVTRLVRRKSVLLPKMSWIRDDMMLNATEINSATTTSEDFNNINESIIVTNDSSGTSLEYSNQFAVSIATSVLLGVMTLTTIIGNIFVIAAIVLERNLQCVANYLILSLAVADLLVAVLVMPLGAVYQISHSWTFGPQLCDMWTSSDVLCCTASILHLVAIAIDRYWAVTQVHYIHSRTIKTIGTMIALIWGISITVSLAPLFGWKDPDFEKRVNTEKQCIVSQDLSYQIFATMSTFYVPLVIILLLYWRIFMTARTRLRKRLAAKANVDLSTNGAAVGAKEPKKMVVEQKTSGSKPISRIEAPNPANEDEISSTNHSNNEVKFVDQGCQTEKSAVNNGHTSNQTSQQQQETADQNPQSKAATKKHVSLEVKRERKAAKTLAIVTGSFIACWLPFFFVALLMPIFGPENFNQHLVDFFLWLGYFNSTLNPIIYTIFSPEFRVAFKRILCGKSHVLNHRPRHLQ